jgi:hypothetical protein
MGTLLSFGINFIMFVSFSVINTIKNNTVGNQIRLDTDELGYKLVHEILHSNLPVLKEKEVIVTGH